MCWQQTNFTPVLRAWAAREGIVLYVFDDKAYARITDLPAAEEHLKFVVTGRNKQVKPAMQPTTSTNQLLNSVLNVTESKIPSEISK